MKRMIFVVVAIAAATGCGRTDGTRSPYASLASSDELVWSVFPWLWRSPGG